MSRLDAGETAASGSGETLRFLFSGWSVVIAVVWGRAMRVNKAETTKSAESESVSTPICALGPEPTIESPTGTLMPTPASVRALVRATPTIVRLQNRALISVSGSQAAEFLNGLLSTAVTTQRHVPFYSSFLHAQVGLLRRFHPQCLNSPST
jgi:hypothetical protein